MRIVLVSFAVLSMGALCFSCAGYPEDEGDNSPALEPVVSWEDAEPSVVAAAAVEAHEAAAAVIAAAAPEVEPEELVAMADEAAQARFAELDPSTLEAGPSLPAATAGEGQWPGASTLSWEGSACRAACWTAAGAGCGAISVACTGVSFITIGGATIPCTWAIIAGCGAAGGGASVCSDMCPP